MDNTNILLSKLRKEEVPGDLRADMYFDLEKYPFEHDQLFKRTNSVIGVIMEIGNYAAEWLENKIHNGKGKIHFNNKLSNNFRSYGNFEVILEDGAVFEPVRVIGSTLENRRNQIYLDKNAKVIGSDIYVEDGSVYIGKNTIVEPFAGIKGPTIIGADTEIRQGAYLRGNCIIGNQCVIRGELKNVVLMNKAVFPHPSYLGDSIFGYMTHFGNQVTAANLGLYESMREDEDFKSIVVNCNGSIYDIEIPKMGICMGDFSQVGCNSVSDPGTFLKPYTVVYSLTRITKGFYGPHEVLKNKPLEYGVVQRVPFNPIKK